MKVDEVEEVLERGRALIVDVRMKEGQRRTLRALVAAVERRHGSASREAIRAILDDFNDTVIDEDAIIDKIFAAFDEAQPRIPEPEDGRRAVAIELDRLGFYDAASYLRDHLSKPEPVDIPPPVFIDGYFTQRVDAETDKRRAREAPQSADGMMEEPNAVMAGAVPDRVGQIGKWLRGQCAVMHYTDAECRLIAHLASAIEQRFGFKAPAPVLPGE